MVAPRIPEGFDFTDPDLYAERLPMEEFAELRRTRPIWWNPLPQREAGFDDEGYWVVTRHADVKEVSRRTDEFSSWQNTAVSRFNREMSREQIELQRYMLLNMDPPEHTKLRGIVSRGFTPRAINRLRETLDVRARQIVDSATAEGTGDFVTDVARELPLQAIAELLGVPQEDRSEIFEWSNQMIAYDDPELSADPTPAATEILGYFGNMAEQRRQCPMDDIVTKLVQADVDGDALTSDEFGFFAILLAVAGNETTRNAITHGMHAFLKNPEQWELFKEQRPETAADEIVRWSTPVVSFQRTATDDVALGDVHISRGDRVVMFYSSANFDPEVFDNPEQFDITRNPNPHVGFGGSGAHYCLGANLARAELELVFNAIADHMPNIQKAGEPRRLRSGWLNGVKEFPVRYA